MPLFDPEAIDAIAQRHVGTRPFERSTTMTNTHHLPIPNSWYALAFTDELRPGDVVRRRLAGLPHFLHSSLVHDARQDFVIWEHKRY